MPDIAAEEKKPEFSASSKRPLAGKPQRSAARIIVPLVLLILLVAGYLIWNHMNAYESTDDAQIDGHINSISARVFIKIARRPASCRLSPDQRAAPYAPAIFPKVARITVNAHQPHKAMLSRPPMLVRNPV